MVAGKAARTKARNRVKHMNKKFILTALIVFTALVSSNKGFARYSSGGREITSGIVRALGWKLSNELLVLEITRLANSSSQDTCPLSGAPFLSLVTRFLLV